MKYYSEALDKLFATEQDLVVAEKKAREAEAAKKKADEEKKKNRATRAKEVEVALKEANIAQAEAIKKLKAFINDYGYYHTSYASDDVAESTYDTFFDVLESFLS